MSENDAEKEDNIEEEPKEDNQEENKDTEKKKENTTTDTNKSEKKDISKSNDTKKKSTNTSSSKKSNTSNNKPNSGSQSKPVVSKPQQEKPSEPKPVEQNKPAEQPKPQQVPEQSKPVEQPKPQPAPEQPKPVERTWEYMSGLSSETFNVLNSFRQANGVAPLAYSSSEQLRANGQAESNAKNKNADHGMMQIALVGDSSSSQLFIDRWAGSAGHKNSMLESLFIEGAVSVYKDSEGLYYVVASLGDGW